jgi:hypothetical protein
LCERDDKRLDSEPKYDPELVATNLSLDRA